MAGDLGSGSGWGLDLGCSDDLELGRGPWSRSDVLDRTYISALYPGESYLGIEPPKALATGQISFSNGHNASTPS